MNKNIKFHGINKTDEIVIHWLLTIHCNYQCSYCIGGCPAVNKDISFADLSVLKNCVDKIFSINKNKYTFVISGGEPTIYPHFIDFCEHILQNENACIYLFSNSHKNTEFFRKLFSYDKFYLNFSIHLEYANINHIKDMIKCSNEYNKYIMCSLMMNPDKKDEYMSFFDQLLEYRKKYYFGLDLGIIHDNKKLDSRYTEDDINLFYLANDKFKEIEKQYFYEGYAPDYYQDYKTVYLLDNNQKLYMPHREAIIKDMKNFRDFYCCQGANSISINHNGDYKGSECAISPFVGNIYYGDIDYFKLIRPIKCSLEGCDCRINNYAAKYIDEFDAKNILTIV